MPEVQLDPSPVCYPHGLWPVKVNRHPPPLADTIHELEQVADRFRVIRRRHGFLMEHNYSSYPFSRKLIKED